MRDPAVTRLAAVEAARGYGNGTRREQVSPGFLELEP